MTDVPDAWPPEPDDPANDPDGEPRVVPVFPLPHVWLFPYMVLPLHVFEPRYRRMIEDSLDGPGRIVLGTIAAGHEEEHLDDPPLEPIAGLGEIGRHERVEGGRYNVYLVGLRRVHIREVESEHAYRLVETLPAAEQQVHDDDESELREQLTEAILERLPLPAEDAEPIQIPPQAPLSHLADLLLLRTPLPREVVSELYGQLDVSARARGVLAEHAVRPLLADDEADDEADDGAEDVLGDD